MAADVTTTLTENIFSVTQPTFTVATDDNFVLISSGSTTTYSDLGPAGSGGGSTRPTTGFLYPRKV